MDNNIIKFLCRELKLKQTIRKWFKRHSGSFNLLNYVKHKKD